MDSGTDHASQMSLMAADQDNNKLVQPGRNATKRFQPVRYATEGEWAMHRTEIQRLYMDEELPLKEVMHTMKEKHSFHATYSPHRPAEYVV